LKVKKNKIECNEEVHKKGFTSSGKHRNIEPK